ncbi:uncharacterized protein LOC105691512 [Athalia rosae]|uniref:uncharacterized protein LOC105691512 n=1 Tax=Athalia rosae TaxID=37344 RepID=UPI00203391AD|nr:uncharacterized protein LOC105691512 [Athalia rosae]
MEVELRVKENGASKPTEQKIPEWLDEDFLQLCMQSGEGDPTIRVINHTVVVVRPSSDLHSSAIYRVSVEFKRRPRSRNILDFKPQETRWLLIKTLNTESEEPSHTEDLQKSKIFDKEITALSTTLPAITKALGFFTLNAQCFYSERSPRALVVLNDLAKHDFIPGKMRRLRGLDFNHCMLVMQSMAALHAGSIAVYEKDKSSMDAFERNVWSEEDNTLVKEFVDRTVSYIADEVTTWPNFGSKYADKIRALKDNLLQRVNAAVSKDKSIFNVLNHGDCWYNNILFRYSTTTDRVEEVSFVDFQSSIFASPVIDLQHFLYSTPTDEVRLQNFNRLIQHYHRELTSILAKLKVQTKSPTMEELLEEMDKHSAYGVLVAFTLLPITLGEGSITSAILRNSTAPSEIRSMLSDEQFRATFRRLITHFDSKGYLD